MKKTTRLDEHCCGRCFSLESKSISRLLAELNTDYVALNWHPDTGIHATIEFRGLSRRADVRSSSFFHVWYREIMLNVILADTSRRINLLWQPSQVCIHCTIVLFAYTTINNTKQRHETKRKKKIEKGKGKWCLFNTIYTD